MTNRRYVGIVTLAVMLGCWAQPIWAAEVVKVGVMDLQAVMEKSKAGKRALEDMKSYSLTRQKIINADDQELKDLEQAIQDPNSKLSDEIKQQKQEQFRTKLEAYQRRLTDFNREIQQKQREMIEDFSKKIAEAAQAVAQKDGYTAILDKGNEALIRVVLYYQPALDITDQVLKEFDRQNK